MYQILRREAFSDVTFLWDVLAPDVARSAQPGHFVMLRLHDGSERIPLTVADYDRDPQWRGGVATMAPDPPGLVQPGTTTSEDLRFGGRRYRNDGEVLEVTSSGPRRSFRWRTVSGADAHGAREVVDHGDGTCSVTLELHVRPHGVERLLAPVLGRMLGRQLREDVARLADLVLSVPEESRRCDAVVNATTIGLAGRSESALPPLAIAKGTVVVDYVYGDTALVRGAREAGARLVTGEALLVRQGALAFTLWTGQPAPEAVMTAAVGGTR